MQHISNSGMNHILAYGGKDGTYYTVDDYLGDREVFVVAKLKDDKAEKKVFRDFKKAIEWAEQ